jgi:hypothetical protein
MKPAAELASDPEAVQGLHSLVRDRLRDLGLVLKAPKKRVFPVTPMRAPSSSRKVFGRPLRDLVIRFFSIFAFISLKYTLTMRI